MGAASESYHEPNELPILVELPGLYVGSLDSALAVARNPDRFPIRLIISLGCGTEISELEQWSQITGNRLWNRVPALQDMPQEDLWPVLQDALPLVRRAQQEQLGVLCHCVSGQSRSVALVCAFLMQQHAYGLIEARNALERSGVDVCMNHGFVHQLRIWNGGRSRFVREMHGLTCMSLKQTWLDEYAVEWETVQRDAMSGIVSSSCLQCRIPLFRPHRDVLHEDHEGYRLFPISWMPKSFDGSGTRGMLGSLRGRLRCPLCSRKLGTFDLSESRQASFFICKSAVVIRNNPRWRGSCG
ncbi:dual specificity phosphatase 19 [Cyanidiococcus yangmingshanensis]|uniref:protein-tyrosine-phosphatase n=1 Tax=Cyanidiococcus yangmingshanensis TaxID=2690220 RepID=A0A7J7IMR9_9RHOD|nr:dual specificity phosphatase 19 [Cyanidiococcus yangmingshanensis]